STVTATSSIPTTAPESKPSARTPTSSPCATRSPTSKATSSNSPAAADPSNPEPRPTPSTSANGKPPHPRGQNTTSQRTPQSGHLDMSQQGRADAASTPLRERPVLRRRGPVGLSA